MTGTRTLSLALVALALALLLALPAAAAPPSWVPVGGPSDRAPGNPVAHCLPERGDDADEPEEEETDDTDTGDTDTGDTDTGDTDTGDTDTGDTDTGDTDTGDTDTGDDAEDEDEKSAVALCVLASLPDIVGNAHAASIVAVVAGGIANGFSDGTFKPQQQVTRGQMATFLARALELAPSQASGLSDVAGTHADAINAIIEAGIANGFGDGTYRPQDVVTRGQMATFLARALELAPSQAGGLSDVAGTHADAINAIIEAGIAKGLGDGTYRPQLPVTRGQMATFLARALEL